MEPQFIPTSSWGQILAATNSLWFLVLSAVIAAGSVLLGHAVIPSMVGTRHLPARAQSLRSVLYAIALLAFGSVLVLVFRFLNLAQVIGSFYPRVWI